MQENNSHRIRHHVQLPGGREIEVVYLDSGQSTPTTAPGEALHVCPHCASGLVHPLDWIEESPGRWRVLLRCPDCRELRDGVFGQALVERLDEELDRAAGALLSDLRQITHANMVEEIERFTRALDLDLISPGDF